MSSGTKEPDRLCWPRSCRPGFSIVINHADSMNSTQQAGQGYYYTNKKHIQRHVCTCTQNATGGQDHEKCMIHDHPSRNKHGKQPSNGILWPVVNSGLFLQMCSQVCQLCQILLQIFWLVHILELPKKPLEDLTRPSR